MKTRTAFNLVTGDRAYSIWFGYNDGDTEYLDAMLEVELDLELITGAAGEVYACRSNLPFPHNLFFKRSGTWEYTEDTDALCKRDFQRLQVICRNFAFN